MVQDLLRWLALTGSISFLFACIFIRTRDEVFIPIAFLSGTFCWSLAFWLWAVRGFVALIVWAAS